MCLSVTLIPGKLDVFLYVSPFPIAGTYVCANPQWARWNHATLVPFRRIGLNARDVASSCRDIQPTSKHGLINRHFDVATHPRPTFSTKISTAASAPGVSLSVGTFFRDELRVRVVVSQVIECSKYAVSFRRTLGLGISKNMILRKII